MAVLKKAVWLFYCEVVCNTLQWILAGAVIAALFWIYGRQLVLTYGYRASDIPVHLNWINQMSRGNLFASGLDFTVWYIICMRFLDLIRM